MGLVILGIFIIYIIISIILILLSYYFGKKKNIKWISSLTTAVVLILLPIWDVLPANNYFNKLCEKDAGLHIYRTVENVDGFLTKHAGKASAESILRKNGYRYIEARKLPKGFARYSLDDVDNLEIIDIVEPSSRYVVSKSGRIKLSWNVSQFDYWIEDTVTGEKLILSREYGYFGNWVIRIIKSYGSTGAVYCPMPNEYLSRHFKEVLIPSDN